MTYQKQKWQDYDDTKTEEQNRALGAVVTTERMNHIETGIEVISEGLSEVERKTAAYDIEENTVNFKETPTVNGKPLLWFGTIEEI